MAGTIAIYDVDIGVQLRFAVVLNGAKANLTSPAPQSMALLIGSAGTPAPQKTFPLTTDPIDSSVATYTVQAGDFPSQGTFVGQVRLTFDAAHVFNSSTFHLRVKDQFQP